MCSRWPAWSASATPANGNPTGTWPPDHPQRTWLHPKRQTTRLALVILARVAYLRAKGSRSKKEADLGVAPITADSVCRRRTFAAGSHALRVAAPGTRSQRLSRRQVGHQVAGEKH